MNIYYLTRFLKTCKLATVLQSSKGYEVDKILTFFLFKIAADLKTKISNERFFNQICQPSEIIIVVCRLN